MGELWTPKQSTKQETPTDKGGNNKSKNQNHHLRMEAAKAGMGMEGPGHELTSLYQTCELDFVVVRHKQC